MSWPGAASLRSRHRAARGVCTIVDVHALKFWTRLLGLAWLLLPIGVWAGRPVEVYEIEIRGAPSPAALEDALKRVLVRATGRSEAAADPALAGIVSNAAHYMVTS